MEYGQLRALRELRDRGSIAAVASAFHVSSPAVSQQLAALQRSAGVALTRREGRRTVLTDAGVALADAADAVLSAMTIAREAVGRYQDDVTATVSVSALSSAAIAFFPALLATAPAGAPTLELTDFDVARADYALLTADIDLVIAHRLPGQPWPSTVRAIPLLEEPLDLAVRRGHQLDGSRPATAEELSGAEWVHVHESFPLAESLRSLAGPGGGDPIVRHRVNDWAITARLLAASNCVALMARHTGQAYLGKSLVLRPLAPELTVSRTIDILARPDTLRRAAARAVIDALQERARELTG